MPHARVMHCAECNGIIALGPADRIGFRDTCDSCNADLHTCHNCIHHDANAHNECREPSAERVSERERANRCEWFAAGDAEGGEGTQVRSGALSDLDALFKK